MLNTLWPSDVGGVVCMESMVYFRFSQNGKTLAACAERCQVFYFYVARLHITQNAELPARMWRLLNKI